MTGDSFSFGRYNSVDDWGLMVMSKLQVAAIETHVADSHTCCLHPASTTHRQMTAEELLAAGVREDLIRYSCGLEDAEDLIADLDQALR